MALEKGCCLQFLLGEFASQFWVLQPPSAVRGLRLLFPLLLSEVSLEWVRLLAGGSEVILSLPA